MAPVVTWKDIRSIPAGFAEKPALDALVAGGWEVENTGLSLDYRLNWNEWMGLREFAQNALDETGRLSIAVDADADGSVMTLVEDEGTGIPLEALDPKQNKGGRHEHPCRDGNAKERRECHCLRGRYGEGMKFGILPTLRAGRRVFVRTVGFDYTWGEADFPRQGKSLRKMWLATRRNDVKVGTTIAVEGLDVRSWNGQDLRMNFTPLLPESACIATVRGGGTYENSDCKVRQLLAPGTGIFVRDILVSRKTKEGREPLFGWNLWFDDTTEVLDPNRDNLKIGAGAPQMTAEIARVLSGLNQTTLDRFVAAIEGKKDSWEWSILEESSSYYLKSNGFDRDAALRLKMAIDARVGAGREWTYTEDIDNWQAVEHVNVVNVFNRFPYGFFLACREHGLVRDPPAIRKAMGEFPRHDVTPDDFKRFVWLCVHTEGDRGIEKLASDYAAAFSLVHRRLNELAKALVGSEVPVKLYVRADGWNDIKQDTGAWFSPSENMICMSMRMLSRKGSDSYAGGLLGVLLHELGHHACGCSDRTDEHTSAVQALGLEFAAWAASHAAAFTGLREALIRLQGTDDWRFVYQHPVNEETGAFEPETLYGNTPLDRMVGRGFHFFTKAGKVEPRAPREKRPSFPPLPAPKSKPADRMAWSMAVGRIVGYAESAWFALPFALHRIYPGGDVAYLSRKGAEFPVVAMWKPYFAADWIVVMNGQVYESIDELRADLVRPDGVDLLPAPAPVNAADVDALEKKLREAGAGATKSRTKKVQSPRPVFPKPPLGRLSSVGGWQRWEKELRSLTQNLAQHDLDQGAAIALYRIYGGFLWAWTSCSLVSEPPMLVLWHPPVSDEVVVNFNAVVYASYEEVKRKLAGFCSVAAPWDSFVPSNTSQYQRESAMRIEKMLRDAGAGQ